MEELDLHTEIFLLKMISADKHIIIALFFFQITTFQYDQRKLLCVFMGCYTPGALPHMTVTLGLVPGPHWPAGKPEALRPSWEGPVQC